MLSTEPTLQETAQQVRMVRVVTEGEVGIARQLALCSLIRFVINNDGNTDANPFFAGAWDAAGGFGRPWALRTVWAMGLAIVIAIEVRRPSVDWIGYQMTQGRGRPM